MAARPELAASVLADLLFEEPRVGRCLVAPDGTVLRVNAEWLRSRGLSREALAGADVVELLPGTRDAALALHARARAGERVELPRHPRRIDGRDTWWEESVAPVAMEGGTGLLMTARQVAGPAPGCDPAPPEGAHDLLRAITETKRTQEALLESEAALREAHERLRMHVETMPLAVVEWDSEYRVTRYSARAEQMFGWRADEVLGRRIDELPWVPEEDWPSVRAVMRDMSSGARPTNVSANRNVRKDGAVIHCEWYNSSIRGDDGRLVSVLSLVLDVTDRKRAADALRASEEQFRALVTASSDVLYRMSPDWTEMRQLQSGKFIADTLEPTTTWLEKYIHPDDQPRVKAAIEEAIRTRSTFELEHRVLRVDGSLGWTFSRAVPLMDASGAITEWFGAASDVTDRKRAEEALLHANEQLRDADRRKNDFLGMLSHELRNPLAPIRNSVYILRRAAPGSEQADRAHAVIERQTDHLTRLVDDLLDATRITTGKPQLRRTRVDLVHLVRQAFEDHQPVFSDRHIAADMAYVAPGPLWVDGDPNRLAQVMGNLLMNAAKFTPEGGRVTVALGADPSAGTASIRVTDTGVGIEPALLSRLFEPFTQGPQSLERRYGGLGLGLALVKGLVELHGGSVAAHSEGPGRGAQFVVELPLVTGSGDDGGRERHPAPPALRRRVLVIEDNRDMAESLREILVLSGHEVAIAFDGEEGIARALAFRPDVVLCDIGLPKMSGYAVAQALRASDALRTATLIALTGYASPEDRRSAIQAGFHDHIGKPPKPDEILAAVAGGEPGTSGA